MVDTLKLQLKDIDNFNSSGDSFDVKLKNGAGCSFDKNNLKCSYNTQRFNEQIEIENIELKSSKKEANRETNKTFDSKVTGDTKVTYNVEYPNSKSGTSGSLNATIAFQGEDNNVVSKESTVSMKGLDDSLEEGGNEFYFFDGMKAQAIIKVEEDSLKLGNKGLSNVGSKLEIESMDQTSSKVDLESRSVELEYDGTYQIRYYTEPYDDYYNLEINIT